MRGKQRLSHIPGFVHSFVAGWVCDTMGRTRMMKAMDWDRHRLEACISGAEPLRAHEVERLVAVFAAACEMELERAEEGAEEGVDNG
jgi:cytochrome c556